MNLLSANTSPESSSYSVLTVTTVEELEKISKEVEYFLKNNAEAHSFHQNPHIILAEHKRNPALIPFTIIIKDKEKLIGSAIGYIRTTRFNLSISTIQLPAPKIRVLNLLGNGLIFAPKYDKVSITKEIFNALQNAKKFFDIISLNEIESNSPLWEYANKFHTSSGSFFRLQISSTKQETISWHELYKTYDDWYRSLRNKTRKRISWEKKRVEKRAPQPIRVDCINKKEQVAEFISQVYTIREDTWQNKTLAKHQSDLESETIFFEEIAKYGWLRSYILFYETQPVAYELCVQYEAECVFLERGYAQSMRNFAPGTYLTYCILQNCYEDKPPQKINFGYGENEFKKRLRTTTKDAYYAYLTMPNRWRALVLCQQSLNIIENIISFILKKINLDRHVRQLLKHKK